MAEYRRRKQSEDLPTRIILALGRALWKLVTLPFGRRQKSRLDRDDYRENWDRVVGLLAHQANEQHWKQAVIEADKLVDRAMRDLLVPGNTFGERLRSAEPRFERDTYNRLWEAHKLRNRIAHEVGERVSQQDAEEALDGFADGLRTLGAL